jgi:Uma2 family endonuclease
LQGRVISKQHKRLRVTLSGQLLHLGMATGLKHPFVTLAEYFAREDSATERLEYLNGEIRSMGGAQPEHNAISANLIAELRSALRGSGCRPMTSDQRVKVNAGSPYLYPDVSVACDPEYAPSTGCAPWLTRF